jgi:hypothetical protein
MRKALRIPDAIVMGLAHAHPLIATFYQHVLCWLVFARALQVLCALGKQ